MNIEAILEKFDLFAAAPGAVERLREVVLELAVRGKLVLQDIADEPASELLKRVLAEKSRQAGRDERMTSDPGQTPNNEQFEVPVNWVWIGATTPAAIVSDQGKKVQTKDILNTGKFPVVDQGKMFIRGFCDDSEKVISAVEPIVLFGDHTRETKFIDFDFVVGADGVKLLKPIFINPRFYFLTLRWLPLESRGYARHFKLLKAARIPLPPLAEQRRIVAKVDHLMSLVDRYESQLTTARVTAARLLDALVAELTGTSRERRAPARQVVAAESRAMDEQGSLSVTVPTETIEPSRAGARRSQESPSRAGARRSQGDPDLLALLRERGSLSSSEAQAATGLDPATLRGLFKTLIDQGLARTEGQRRGMRYLPTAKAAHAE